MSDKGKSRLGRGLSSLISISDHATPAVADLPKPAGNGAHAAPTTVTSSRAIPDPAAAPPTAGLATIPVDRIAPNPHQPRRRMNDTSIAELAASLKSTGLIQPIVVRKVGDQYQLIAGERRWRASKLAGLADIPAIIKETTSVEQAQMALIENIQREDLNPIDRALAYRTLMTHLGLTQAELASRTGEDRSSVANYLRLLDLAEPVQTMVIDGRLSLGHAKVLAGVADPVEQQKLAEIVVGQGLSVRHLERQIQEAKPTETRATPGISPHLQDLEKSISRQLGLRVQVRSSSKGRGKLILHYGSLDQFDDLVGRLGVRVEG